MLSTLKQRIISKKDQFIKLEPKQKYTIIAIGASVLSLVTISLYWSHRTKKAWEKSQEPILSQYWSDTYYAARDKFRKSCAKINNCKTYSISVDPIEDLTVDLCYIPSMKPTKKPTHLLIHMSGTHGVEAFTGSAIQSQLMEQIAKSNHNECNILFVHALNAYGMTHGRRCNRYNVDLNRNTILNKEGWKKLKARDPNMLGYDSISTVINPGYKPSYPWTDIAVYLRFIGAIIKSGSLAKAGRAIVNGQYHNATGIFYGGFQLQNEPKKLFNFLTNGCKEEWNVDLLGLMKDKDSKLTIIDVHTGIGPKGVDSLYTKDSKYMDKLKNIQALPREYFEDKQRLQMREGTGEYADVYKHSVGGIIIGISKLFMNKERFVNSGYESDKDGDKTLDDRVDCLPVTEEFGTVPSTKVIHALIMENAIYNLHVTDEESQSVLKFRQQRLRNIFYLQNDIQWKYNVLQRGLALFQCLSRR